MRRIVGPTGLLVLVVLFPSTPSSQQLRHTLYVNNTDPHRDKAHGLKTFEDRGCFLQQHGIKALFSSISDRGKRG
jgi:hypothetical protein